MKPLRFLPETEVLDALLTAAGVDCRPKVEKPQRQKPIPMSNGHFSLAAPGNPQATPISDSWGTAFKPDSENPRQGAGHASASGQPMGHSIPTKDVAAMPAAISKSNKKQEPKRTVFRFNSNEDLETNLEKFLKWLIARNAGQGAFVADSQGLPLVCCNTPDFVVESTAPLRQGLHQVKDFVPYLEAGSSIYYFNRNRLLQLVWCDTALGPLVLGILLKEPLKQGYVAFVRKVLKKIID